MTVDTFSTENLSLDGLRGLNGVLDRLPQGAAARTLAEKMGLWSTSTHANIESRMKAFPTSFSRMSDPDLSDANAYWLSEVFRATELVGLLEGQKTLLTLQARQVRSGARAQLRRQYKSDAEAAVAGGGKAPKDPTVAQLGDEIEENQNVRDIDATLGLLLVVLESAKAYKEGCLAATAGLSREISFRQAQMGARLR